MIKIVGSEDDNHFESAYRRKQFNYYGPSSKAPKILWDANAFKISRTNMVGSFFRVTYRLFKKACRKRHKIQKSLKEVIDCLAKDYVEQNNDMLGGKLK